MKKPILIFPAGMPRSLEYLERARTEGSRVIGSSSLGHDPARKYYPEWVHLPYITEPTFDDALRGVIDQFDVGGVFSPNPVVWEYLHRRIGKEFSGISLVNPSPMASEVAPYLKALSFAHSVAAEPLLADGSAKPRLSVLEIGALFRHVESIPGMCDHEKLRALCEIFRYAPEGDIVEIGSWWGKSAFALARLSACYGTGSLLCVDPWRNENLVQKDEKGLVDGTPVDADEAFTIFNLNLIPYAHGSVNYLRMPSVDAAAHYRRSRTVSSETFGTTNFSGCISVLHIDGNHGYEHVRADMDAWADMVVDGGWVVVDDYVWPYGDGPKRVGDEYLAAHVPRVEKAFVIGSALFIRTRAQ